MKVVYQTDKEILISTTAEDDQRFFFTDEIEVDIFCREFVNMNMKELHSIAQKMNLKYYYILPTVNTVQRDSLDDASLAQVPDLEVFFEPIVCVPVMKYYLFHLPKTMGRYVSNNYWVFRAAETLDDGGHPTFNKSHQTVPALALINAKTALPEMGVAILRNPFDWLASFFFTNKGAGWEDFRETYPDLSFEDFIGSICSQDEIGTWLSKNVYPFDEGLTSPMFDENRILRVKNFIFFERLEAGLEGMGIDRKVEGYWTAFRDKKFDRPRKSSVGPDYRSHYNDRMKKMVYDKFKFDLDFGGYDFNGLIHEESVITKESAPLFQEFRYEVITKEDAPLFTPSIIT